MVTVAEKPRLKVVRQSEFIATCDCEDFWRHREYEQPREEFLGRKARSRDVKVVGYEVRYGSVVVKLETQDRRGRRPHEVMLGRGDGDPYVCKHVISALRSKALMPEYRNKTVVLSEDAARNLARMYVGRLLKRGRRPEVVLTTVNNVYVVGWWKESE
jgi:hypothetical protein